MAKHGRMWRTISLAVLFIVSAVMLCLFSACGDNRVFITLYDGDNVYSTVLTNENGYVVLPTPEKAGYTFDKWYIDKNLRSPYSYNRFSGNASLYIGWIPNEYTLTFDSGEGSFTDNSVIKTVTVKSGDGLAEVVISISEPYREHYEFGGWMYDGEAVDLDDTFEYAANVTFGVKWIPHTSIITYDAQDGMLIDNNGEPSRGNTQTVAYDSVFSPYTAKKTGYDFIRWRRDDDTSLEPTDKWATEENISVTAVYEQKEYTVRFIIPGEAEPPASAKVKYENPYDFAEYEKELPGRIFDHWECVLDGKTYKIDSIGSAWQAAGDSDEIVLTAVYAGREYDLTFEVDGQIIETVTELFGSEVTFPADPKSDNRVFIGWFIGEERLLPDSTWRYPENKTALARFADKSQAIPFTVEYYFENGDGEGKERFVKKGGYTAYGIVGETVVIDKINIQKKYSGDLYFFSEDFSYDGLYNSPFELTVKAGNAENSTLKYYFQRETFTYTLVINGRNISLTARWGQTVKLPQTPSNPGYEFEGWTWTVDSNLITEDFVMPKDNVVLTAQWSQTGKNYTVFLDGEYAFEISYDEMLTTAHKTKLRLNNTYENYFMGWTLNGERVISAEGISSMSAWQVDGGTKLSNGNYRLELTSDWKPVVAEYSVDIYLETEDGTFVKSAYGEYSYKDYGNVGTTVFLNPDFNAPEGYSYDSTQAGNKLIAQLDLHTVLSAYFLRMEYTVTYSVDDREIIRQVGWGKTVSDIDVVGYKINDWLLKGEHFNGIMPCEDITLVADYTPNRYVLSFINNYNEYDKTEAKYNAEYDFSGLVKNYGENEFVGIIVGGEFVSAEDMLKKSVWDIDGGTEIGDGIYELTVLIVWKTESNGKE